MGATVYSMHLGIAHRLARLPSSTGQRLLDKPAHSGTSDIPLEVGPEHDVTIQSSVRHPVK